MEPRPAAVLYPVLEPPDPPSTKLRGGRGTRAQRFRAVTLRHEWRELRAPDGSMHRVRVPLVRFEANGNGEPKRPGPQKPKRTPFVRPKGRG